MTAATVIVLVVSVFAAFAAGLTLTPQRARQLNATPANTPRPKRRPF